MGMRVEEGAKKKNEKVSRDKENSDVKRHKKGTGRNESRKVRENYGGDIMEKIEKKKKKKKSERKKGDDNFGAGLQETMDEKMGNESTTIEGKCFIDNEGDGNIMEKIEKKMKKKKKKSEKKKGDDNFGAELQETMDEKMGNESTIIEGKCFIDNEGDGDIMEKIEKKKKKKRKSEKKKGDDNFGAGLRETMDEKMGNESSIIEGKYFIDNEGSAHSSRNKTQDREKKKGKNGKRKRPESLEIGSEDPKSKGKSKKVRFSGHVEVFPSSDDPSNGKEKNHKDDLVRGKRFSQEEDEMIKEAVFNYIKEHGLGEEGLNMVLHCKSHPELKNCWKAIGAVLPYRPHESIYYRAHILFERDEKRAWTSEEYELVRKFHEEHGPDWRKLADALGKHRFHVKDTWRRIKLPNMKKGHWSQEEYQTLFDLVNMDLRMKAFEEKKSKHGMLRDNICWGAISDKLSTRSNALCCMKWYNQLTSAMVAEGEWADADDYRLLIALYSLDACCIEDVDWDYLLDHRSGDVCRKRWNQMIRHLGDYTNKSFAEQVEVLSKRYCPDILESREMWDNKPVIS